MFRSRRFNLIVSIIAAVVIWGFVVTYINPTIKTTIGGVVVEMVNLDALAEAGLAVSTAQTHTVDVVVQGSRAQIGEIEASDLKATIDMKGFAMGLNTVRVSVAVPNGLGVVEIRPERIEVNVEERVSAMKPIVIEYLGAIPEDSEPGLITLSPKEIEVSGTREQVESVSYIRALIESNALAKESRTIAVDAVPLTNVGYPINDLSLSQSMIDVTIQLCSVKEVSLQMKVIGEAAEGWAMTKSTLPKTVFIRGAASKLQSITEVTAKDINITGLRENKVFTPELTLPQGVELSDQSQDLKAGIEIEAVEKRTFKFTEEEIEITGAAIGYPAEIGETEIAVTVSGTAAQMENMTADNLTLYVDLSTLDDKIKESDVVVLIRIDKPYYKVECSPKDVHVTISKAPVRESAQAISMRQ
ncbi:MAG: hypothetical protein LBN36_00540 [Clostridiales Family XIII bacterium]|nr:hypothetical protein [Clostridiales Family XIII bacterium]